MRHDAKRHLLYEHVKDTIRLYVTHLTRCKQCDVTGPGCANGAVMYEEMEIATRNLYTTETLIAFERLDKLFSQRSKP